MNIITWLRKRKYPLLSASFFIMVGTALLLFPAAEQDAEALILLLLIIFSGVNLVILIID